MAQLNFGLLNTNAPAEIAGAYGRGQQEALQTRQQTAATQGAEMNLARLKQEHDALDKLMTDITANGGPSDPLQAAQMMIDSRHPEWFAKGLAMKQSYMQLDADRQAMGLPPLPKAAAPAPAAAPANALAPMATPAPANAPMNALAPATAPMTAAEPVNALANTDKTAQINQAKSMLLSSNPGVRTAGEQQLKMLMAPPVMHTVAPGASLVGPDGKPLFTAAERADTDLIRNFNAAKAQGFKGNIFDYEREIKLAGRTPPTPAQPSAPVAVIDPATGQAIYVSREEALRNKMQPAANAPALKPLTEGQTIKLRTDVGKDYQNASTALSQIDDLLKSATAVKTSPGLSAATGYTGKYLPSFSEGAAAQAETRLANLRGKVTALGKATASMGGAIGSIATQEWKVLADQVAVLDETKGTKPLLEQIGLLEDQARRSAELIRDKYEKTRAEDFERFPQFRDLPTSKALGGAPAAGTGGFKYLGKEGG